MLTTSHSTDRQCVMQLASIAGNMLADNMPPGAHFLILAYSDGAANAAPAEDYLVCFRSQQDSIEAIQMLRQMADSIEDGLQAEHVPTVARN